MPDHFRADQKLKHVVECIVQMPLNRLGASTTSLGSLFQGLTTLSVKKCFLVSRVILPWHSFQPLPHVPSLGTGEKSSAPPSPLPLLRKL